jgi:phosphoenolpyruvate carboxykinase (GTP)
MGRGKRRKRRAPQFPVYRPRHELPCISPEFESAKGVPLSAIIFGGRRAKTAPLVYEARSWEHGVFVGSAMASETTAAAAGAVGVVRRDPMAMLPFCGYHMGDYFAHWLEMGKNLPNAPKIFNVNWFRVGDDGHFIWPGFGDNMRVLDWIIKRCEGLADAVETPIGFLPRPEDICLDGLDGIDASTIRALLSVETGHWLSDIESLSEFYDRLGEKLPGVLKKELISLKERLQ